MTRATRVAPMAVHLSDSMFAQSKYKDPINWNLLSTIRELGNGLCRCAGTMVRDSSHQKLGRGFRSETLSSDTTLLIRATAVGRPWVQLDRLLMPQGCVARSLHVDCSVVRFLLEGGMEAAGKQLGVLPV